MPRFQCRSSIALAAVVVALLWSRPADAQIGYDPGPPREPGGLWNNLVTGVHFELTDQAKAEHRLHHLEARLGRDAGRGCPDAVDRDVRRIDRVRYRIAVDEWLIRKNSLCNPGPYPYPLRLDPISCEAIGQYRRPPHFH